MIEIIGEIKDAPAKLDIATQLAISAYNVIRQYCEGQEACKDCAFNNFACAKGFGLSPDNWPDIN